MVKIRISNVIVSVVMVILFWLNSLVNRVVVKDVVRMFIMLLFNRIDLIRCLLFLVIFNVFLVFVDFLLVLLCSLLWLVVVSVVFDFEKKVEIISSIRIVVVVS